MDEDLKNFRRAVMHKAAADARFAFLVKLNKVGGSEYDKHYLAGLYGGTAEARTAGTPFFAEWPEQYTPLYIDIFLRKWDELERQQSGQQGSEDPQHE